MNTEENNTNHPMGIELDNYDRGLVPAETAARMEREGSGYKHKPEGGEDHPETRGYTVDQEGLANNYAIEPEMYVNEPGDLRERDEELAAERAEEMRDVNEDKDGDLTMESDRRGKGQGMI